MPEVKEYTSGITTIWDLTLSLSSVLWREMTFSNMQSPPILNQFTVNPTAPQVTDLIAYLAYIVQIKCQ